MAIANKKKSARLSQPNLPMIIKITISSLRFSIKKTTRAFGNGENFLCIFFAYLKH